MLMLCEYTLLVAMTPCLLVLAVLCFLTFCGRLAGRVLLCCSILVSLCVLKICLWWCFLVSCWGAILLLLLMCCTGLRWEWHVHHSASACECAIDLSSPTLQPWFSFEASLLTRYFSGLNKEITLLPTLLKINGFFLSIFPIYYFLI
jgi:hypothetical protein